ncbi:MAG: 7-cyano-7-deazaguanine synthase QueC [Bdellovibrionales bacterium RIFOXYD1_FULL_44_7]|nr:MAG: 7-cyano-7-deazaguanine synthase QueC [Bdellovibrionales bacterium RIFOXYD1_FULL_44_7]
MRSKSVVLLSGGLDSAANLAIAADRDQVILAVTFDYGQKAAKKEIAAARKFTAYYDVRHEVIELPFLREIGGSSLIDYSQSVPSISLEDLEKRDRTRETAKSVWVPNRNGIMINIAAAFAEKLVADQIVVGFNKEEAVNFRDNSLAFLERVSDSLAMSTANSVKAACYTVGQDKREIVRTLVALPKKFPFEYVWSCYLGEETQCGSCESCRRFERALSVLNQRG